MSTLVYFLVLGPNTFFFFKPGEAKKKRGIFEIVRVYHAAYLLRVCIHSDVRNIGTLLTLTLCTVLSVPTQLHLRCTRCLLASATFFLDAVSCLLTFRDSHLAVQRYFDRRRTFD